MTARSYPQLRASSADRERTILVLQRSFVEGRLTRDELDERLSQALQSNAFYELIDMIADLPVGPFERLPAHPSSPPLPKRRPAITTLMVSALAWLAMVSILVWAIVTS
jgi:Domain of unknown function (DUF1707)